jgi:hypothetical protein
MILFAREAFFVPPPYFIGFAVRKSVCQCAYWVWKYKDDICQLINKQKNYMRTLGI